ncbi:hypothetical protein F4553_002065 [Allocatelliglobosispora scoriae]|uniref:Uncharacterized protein n=1 Tax=Allocatelliglobosispora scoriae TaxID=643052 RepID=A0A841BN25_9ACTN|nr:hypothetical protein [Allocatelliglobosispora scoriae]MBB5868686.1 hypothetical protein [Allocatelliglobosispora scoriae]
MDQAAVRDAFSRYSSAQAVFGLSLVRRHRPGGTGECRACGRPHPCEQRRRGAELIVHFG